MAEKALTQILGQLRSAPPQGYPKSSDLLSRAKLHLHALHALSPSPQTPSHVLPLAREVYELGALLAIRAIGHLSSLPDPPAKIHDTIAAVREAFLRNVTQLRPFYDLPASSLYPDGGKNAAAERNKVTGLYLLLLLTEGKYAEFHSELETLTVREEGSGWAVESDKFLAYPVRLERWLMEGSYDRVWKAMKSREVPCEEYGVFSDILTQQIRSEIASSSERAYPKLPLGSTKSLLFLDSEGAVVSFARERGWVVRDGEIFFPVQDATTISDEGDVTAEKEVSQMVIENALGYARELETIV